MIQILGLKRIVILAVLLSTSALFGGVYYGYMQPEKAKQERQLGKTKSDNSKLRKDIDNLRVELSQLEDKKERFEEVSDFGFFYPQPRDEAEELLNRVQSESGVIKAVASIGSGTLSNDEEVEKAGYKVLTSPIDIDIEAMDDIDVYRYFYILKSVIPGQVLIEKFEIKRDVEISGSVLRSISTGANLAIVRASARLSWSTMIPAALEEER